MDTEWYSYLLVTGIGVITGFINTLAGAGSLLTLPFLMLFIGLPATVANGTNRIGILMQGIVATKTFADKKVFSWKTGFRLGIPAVIGSVGGASLAVSFNETLMNYFIGGLLIFMLILMMANPERWIKGHAGKIHALPYHFQFLIFLIIGAYGGFIQAGVGFFLLAGLVLGSGNDLLSANALKVFITTLFTLAALPVFIIFGQVDYLVGLFLALGSMAGAYAGAKLAIKNGAPVIRWIVMIMILLSALKLFGLDRFLS